MAGFPPPDIRRVVVIDEETWAEAGRAVSPPTRKVAACAVLANPLAGRPAQDDLEPLMALSVEVGTLLARRALAALGGPPTAYGKAVIVGTAGDREHGAALIHPRLGLAMRRVIGGGRALIPGTEKVAGPGAAIDLVFGGLDDAWEYDAMDAMEVAVAGAPTPDEVVLVVGLAAGGRPNARVRGATPDEVAAAARKGARPAP
jgi:Amino acid synthesis